MDAYHATERRGQGSEGRASACDLHATVPSHVNWYWKVQVRIAEKVRSVLHVITAGCMCIVAQAMSMTKLNNQKDIRT